MEGQLVRRFNLEALKTISKPPSEGLPDWLSHAEDGAEFLKSMVQGEEILLYASASAVLIHGVLAPISNITPANHDDLLSSFIQLDDCWRIQRTYGGGEGHRVYLEPPLCSQSCKSLVGGEKLIYRRQFHGVHEGPPPIELSQKLVHSLDIHFIPERNAFCRLDNRGDIEDVIRIVSLDDSSDREGSIAVTILAKDLTTYMVLSNTALVYRFDFTRFVPGSFSGWNGESRHDQRHPDLFYSASVVAGHASYANGCMIVRPTRTIDDIVKEWQEEIKPQNREYATFKIVDRKNNVEIETSCAPEYLSNYFQKSDLPWEISPVFFQADVLHRFKADPEKYTLEDRSITCRGAWYLKTYDINAVGQVHTYIGYLADLPIEEQRYWQAFNEWPKGPISKRAHENDILGEWSSAYDSLNAIKSKVRTLDQTAPAWWKVRGDVLSDAARYPATDSVSEWANEILALDQLLVEGFLVKPIKTLAVAAGATIETNWASLKVLEEYLAATGHTLEEAKNIVAPLRKLHSLRSQTKGHGAVSERRNEERAARSQFGTLRAHFTALTAECDAALAEILVALKSPDEGSK
jgi:hypothetical protein